MRAFSEKRFNIPQVSDEYVELSSKTDKTSVRVADGIRYIRKDNTTETYRPKLLTVNAKP